LLVVEEVVLEMDIGILIQHPLMVMIQLQVLTQVRLALEELVVGDKEPLGLDMHPQFPSNLVHYFQKEEGIGNFILIEILLLLNNVLGDKWVPL
tara:strand:+ start:378 stop:659 length:282 start_codon:yes stop_codon:yes gene_type:complete